MRRKRKKEDVIFLHLRTPSRDECSLLIVGISDPPLKVKVFIQTIRHDETRDETTTKRGTRMSNEYKILNKLCPVYYDKNADLVVRKVYPFEHYHNIRQARHLWTGAFVKLVLDEKTENDYRFR